MSINKTNKDIPFIHHEMIEEWDIRSANTSLMRYYNLVDMKNIEKFEKMSKSDREINVGLFLKNNRDVSNALEKSFTDIIYEFINSNELEPSSDIISIKKDAIFVRNKVIHNNIFGEVEFVKKNTYTGCLLLPKYEFYYSSTNIDVKGISNESLKLHEDGILSFVSLLMKESKNWVDLNVFMKDYAKAYKNRDLTFNSYREFNSNSKFKVNLFNNYVYMDYIDEDLLEDTDISFNYMNIYLPTLKAIAT